jgi:purine nucleoside phosphorylase
MTRRLGLIGGTGAAMLLPAMTAAPPRQAPEVTPWGSTSAPLLTWHQGDAEIVYVARHGSDARIAPHRVNYRANVWALRQRQVDAVIGLNAVGGITPGAWPGRVVLPDQLVDYTWGREHTFCDGTGEPLRHIEFDPPFSEDLRRQLLTAAGIVGTDALARATYGVTQGPRLETAAEIDRLAADGCDVVGMTAMPEAALAKEAGLPYAICAVVVNRAAGRLPAGESIHRQLAAYLEKGMGEVHSLLQAFCAG